MKELVAKLEGLLRLRSIPFGMKLYESVAEMEAIPKVRANLGACEIAERNFDETRYTLPTSRSTSSPRSSTARASPPAA